MSVQVTEKLSRQRRFLEHCQTFKMVRFVKRIVPEYSCATINFSGQWRGFVELGHFDKCFVKNTRQRGPRKETFWSFFQNQDTFFDFRKGQGRPPLSPLVSCLRICLIMLENKLPDYAMDLNMQLILLKKTHHFCNT